MSLPNTTVSRLPQVSSDTVLERLDGLARASDDAIVACDADGTLWAGDIGMDTFALLLEERAIRPAALPALVAEARRHAVAVSDDATEQARLLQSAFEQGSYPEEAAFAMMAWAFAGHTVDEVKNFAARVVARVGLRQRLHPEILPILDWVKHRGVPFYVVSASPALVISTALASLALPPAQVLAMSPVIASGVLLPQNAPPITYGAGKVHALHAAAPRRHLIAAFGDSAFDLPMLSEASLAVAVRPKPQLLERAASLASLYELAPAVT